MSNVVYRVLLLSLFSVEGSAQMTNRVDFITLAEEVSTRDSITFNDLNKLLSYDSAIADLYGRNALSLKHQIIFKKIDHLIDVKKLTSAVGYNDFVENLESGDSYTFELLRQLGSDFQIDVASPANIQTLFLSLNVLFGNGFQLDKESREFHYRPMWGWEGALNWYPFNDKSYQVPTRTFIPVSVGQLFVIKGTEGVLYFTVSAGIGRDMKNFNSFAVSYEYLIDHNGIERKNYHGVNAFVTSDAFTFGIRTYYTSDDRVFFLMVKYDVLKLFGRRGF